MAGTAGRAAKAMRAGHQASAGDLLELVRSGRATTRGALQQATGLSRATVGQRLDRLFRAGWLREGAGGPVDSPQGGRPSITLEFDDEHAVVLAADLDTRHGRAAVVSLSGEIQAEHHGSLRIEDGPDAVLGELGRWFAELLEKAGQRADAVCGIGLAVPGPVDTETGKVVQPPIMPGWDGYDIRGRLGRAFAEHAGVEGAKGAGITGSAGIARGGTRIPVLVDNDANLMAYGEQRTGYPDCSAFALVKVSTGIGAGMVVGGSVYRGVDGGAGDIGHIRVGADALCRCGSYGCLAAVASGGAVARRLAESGVPATSGSDVRDLLTAGHPEAMALAREAGRQVGDVLATVVTLLNPGVLMIAGDLSGTPFLTGVRELLYQRALPRSTAHLDVVTSRLGERAGLVGAGALVVEYLYAPERVEERLAALGV
ncbi:ROK family protein [Streptomyces sp. NBC_01728]|uniref:ROK family transcriptional regulator n=1 Tax=unclassified Streptomyces TaxID=2593676 RepID=UPI00225948BD|nr:MULTISPECIES: ROK family protein [unclassified Streptomyces]MCX4453928.1 ROK family protein [Streptomyces sp. NBC_01719]MCX4493288.1 ROK family protein [Streptomyces sp. NBC_01728]